MPLLDKLSTFFYTLRH